MRIFILCAFVFFLIPGHAHAAQDGITTELAQVSVIEVQEQRPVPGTGVVATFQTLRANLLGGPRKGEEVTVLNDYLKLSVGEKFYALHTVDALTGIDAYTVSEPYRVPELLALVALFVVVVLLVGGMRGVRGLLALGLSFFFILYLLLPGILVGFPPVVTAFGVASLIIVLGSYITHGFNRVTTSAVLGMIATIAITAGLAMFAIYATHLSGFASEEAVYLNIDTAGKIDFSGLLLGGILIGLLGVLYDAAIGQAVAVDELCHASPDVSRAAIFKSAMRIGREHIGALVNTLAIAYVGVALPLLLLFYSVNSDTSILTTLNREVFAGEIVRMVVSSVGLVLAVPITTLISVYFLLRRGPRVKTTDDAFLHRH